MIAVDHGRWAERWEAQQDRYMPDREERFRLMLDVLATVVGDGPATVLDVGCGPGSLAVRVLARFPRARVIGVDVDPVLLAIGRGARGGDARLTFAEADLRDPGWTERLGLDGQADAALSTTALHWLALPDLTRLYGDLARVLRPGAMFLDGDHRRFPGSPRLERAARAIAERARASRARPVPDAETWEQWWAAVRAEPAFAAAVAERDRMGHAHADRVAIDDAEHCRLLRAAGFAEAVTVWQQGDDRILAAVR
jgi:SAM-dependent methyltransferase